MMEAVREKPSLSCEGNDGGGIMKGKRRAATAKGSRSLVFREVIMMHEGPLHVYDMIVSDLLAPRGN